MKEYEELKAQALTAKIEDCHKRLYVYGVKKFLIIGWIQVEISAGNKKMNSHSVVTKSMRCLLGHETPKALGLLQIGLGGSVHCNVVGLSGRTQPQPFRWWLVLESLRTS